MNTIYAQRRARLAASLQTDDIAIIPTAAPAQRNSDCEFPYRHDSYFYYLCGFTEPHAVLVITGQGHCTLFCQPKDEAREIWDGIRLGPDAAIAALGVDQAYAIEDLDKTLPTLLANRERVAYPFGIHPDLESRIATWLDAVRARRDTLCPQALVDLRTVLDEMRLFKDDHELDIMRRAAAISAQAHVRAMQWCAHQLRLGKPVFEYEIEAELLHEFRRHGSQFPAYSSIVAAGANACILHYHADKAPVRSGELVLIDAGCELDGYASDISRTFPANGQFTGPQRAVYDVVHSSQEAAVIATRAKAPFHAPHDAALKVLAQGLLDLGLLDANFVGGVDDVISQRAYTPFYMHRTSHWLGMDVHDCGSYNEPGKSAQTPRLLQPRMVLTLEPGLYIRPSANVPERFHNIGIRIEDDAVVTSSKCELISRGVPVRADELEALMRA